MGVLAAVATSAVPLIVAGAVMFFLGRYRDLPGASHPWICRLLIALMFCAGAALVVSPIGSWLVTLLHAVAGWIPGAAGLQHIAVTLGALSLLLTAAWGMWHADDKVVTLALFLPLVLSLPAGGFLHEVYTATTAPAQQTAAAFSAWLGG
jgi:hypothetical protein